jgi:hypothetical protein
MKEVERYIKGEKVKERKMKNKNIERNFGRYKIET